jgi:hypothetical protein
MHKNQAILASAHSLDSEAASRNAISPHQGIFGKALAFPYRYG